MLWKPTATQSYDRVCVCPVQLSSTTSLRDRSRSPGNLTSNTAPNPTRPHPPEHRFRQLGRRADPAAVHIGFDRVRRVVANGADRAAQSATASGPGRMRSWPARSWWICTSTKPAVSNIAATALPCPVPISSNNMPPGSQPCGGLGHDRGDVTESACRGEQCGMGFVVAHDRFDRRVVGAMYGGLLATRWSWPRNSDGSASNHDPSAMRTVRRGTTDTGGVGPRHVERVCGCSR